MDLLPIWQTMYFTINDFFRKLQIESGMLIAYRELLLRAIPLFAARLLCVISVRWMVEFVQLQNVNPFVSTCTNVVARVTISTIGIFVSTFIGFILSYN